MSGKAAAPLPNWMNTANTALEKVRLPVRFDRPRKPMTLDQIRGPSR